MFAQRALYLHLVATLQQVAIRTGPWNVEFRRPLRQAEFYAYEKNSRPIRPARILINQRSRRKTSLLVSQMSNHSDCLDGLVDSRWLQRRRGFLNQ